MIGLDTNVTLRMLLADDPRQTSAAQKLAQSFSADQPGFINLITLAELIWVLQSGYRYSKTELIAVVEFLLARPDLQIQQEDLVREAVARYHTSPSGLVDLLIALVNRKAGCDTTYTFDRSAGKLDEMTLA